ncbi:hypothetical protein PQG02_18810 [Nostoc sp. UHCC 0926]|uniref:hypothetical protein n=1 Tax=Nostoc sp. TaxID=1180 RepID=UPI00279B41BB|nr:hypothetical protein PQG02_18810 [Nostoc sp. UHCC 0926]
MCVHGSLKEERSEWIAYKRAIAIVNALGWTLVGDKIEDFFPAPSSPPSRYPYSRIQVFEPHLS